MKILVIDGNSILNRAFYGIKALSNSKGFFTNAITGFMNIYLKELDAVKPQSVAVAFDLKAPTFRHQKCDYYKANRKGMPQELAMQLPKLKELLGYLGIPVLELEGFEADDILGSVAKIFAEKGEECVVLSGDRDNLQLITDKTTVRLATNKETVSYDRNRFFEEYGFEPINLIDAKAFMGDSSDNIPGVAGIGEKTAFGLVKEYGTLENIYAKISTAKLGESARTKILNGREIAEESKWLATINCNAPVSKNLEDYSFKEPDNASACALLSELEMFKLIERLGLENCAPRQADEAPKQEFSLQKLTLDTVKSLSGRKTYFELKNEGILVLCENTVYQTESKEVTLAYLESDALKSAFEGKTAYKLCMQNDKSLKNLNFCFDLSAYLLSSQSTDYSVNNLCAMYGVPFVENGDFSCLCSLPMLKDTLCLEIEKAGMEKLLYEIEMPLCEVLASMEVFGICADSQGIKDFGESLKAQISELEQSIYLLAGHEFNIASPMQLGNVLFEELGLPAGKKNKNGYSTSAEILEGLVGYHPIISDVLEYRTLTKLLSTYVDGLLTLIHPDGRVRSEFKQTETRTGRISSANPNMQNIPVRKEVGRKMRNFFIAKDGYVFLDADYSQIELRVLASMCDDENMIQTFVSGKDIHTRTASQVFGLPEEMVDSDMRRAAKAVNFGIVYGIGAFSLSKDIDVSVAEADRYIKSYLANYPGVDKFMKETVENAEKLGFVTTLFGRRRYIPELSASNKIVKSFGKRAAMNAPVQGTAADIIKIAMVKVYQRLKQENLDAKLILQVHDELIVEANENCAEKAAQILQEEMINAVALKVPLIADVGRGKNWFEAKE